MIKILVAEDEPKLRFLIAGYLKAEGYTVVAVTNGEEALERFYSDIYAACILDIMMPKLDGLSVCKEIVDSGAETPCVLLTAKNTELDELAGFAAGAVEYITKPFSPKILLTRIKSIIKRAGLLEEGEFVCGDLSLSYREHAVRVGGERVILTPREYDLLTYLIRNKNIVLGREQLLSGVWGFDYDGDERTVDTHIKCLRTKLGDCGKYIITLRKVGYKFETPS